MKPDALKPPDAEHCEAIVTERGLKTVGEVADELRVSRLTVYRRIANGDLDAVRLGPNGPLRVPTSALEDFLRPAE